MFNKLGFLAQKLNVIYDENAPSEDKQAAIDKIRLQGWNQMLQQKPIVLKLKANHYAPINEDEILVLTKCLGTVYMELLLQDLEIKIYS